MLPIGYKYIRNRSVTQINFSGCHTMTGNRNFSVANTLFIAANSTLYYTYVVLDLL
jgi:hypothetical protein